MFDNLKNLASMMSQAREMKAKMEVMQAELTRRTVEGDAGSGAVRVVMNGKFEVQAVKFNPAIVAALSASAGDADRNAQLVGDLTTQAFNAALARAQDLVREEMNKVTGGMDLGAMSSLLGGK